MKRILPVISLITITFCIACSGEKNSAAGKPQIITSNDAVKDSVVFYETDIEARQKSFKAELVGQWKVVGMRRQPMTEMETLQNAQINFSNDSSFTGNAPCNKMGGIYTLKGNSVRFSGVYTTKMACANMAAESAFLELLQQRVSVFIVKDNKLQLLDGSTNVIFECEKL